MSRLIFTASLVVLFVSFVYGVEDHHHHHHTTQHHGHQPDQCEPYCQPGVIKYYPDVINCTKFWHCDNGVPVRHVCPPKLYFNPNKLVCDYPIQAGCTANANNACHPKTTTVEPENTTYAPETTTPEPETTTPEPETTTPEPETTTSAPTTPKHHPTQCEPYCRPGLRYFTPDTINCTEFWHCVDGVPFRHFCPQGLHFNPDRWYCTYPIQAGCTANPNNPCHPKTTTPEPETTTYAPETTTPEPETTTYAPETTTYVPETTTHEPTTPKHHPTQCEPYCSPNGTYYTPDIINCTKSWRCDHGEATVQSCPHGLYFNPKTWACDYPIEAGCTANPNNPCHPRTTTVEPETTTYVPETTTKKPETTTKKPETTTVAPETTTVEPETTTKKPKTTTAAPETTTKKPETTTAAPETTTYEPETTTKKPETTTAAPETTTVAPETTTKKPETTTTAPETTTVAPETTTYKPETTTYKPETTTLKPCKPDGCVPGVINYFPDVRDCTKFWQCDHGEPVHQNCPKGTYFNPKLWVCDWPDHAGCTAKPNNPCHPKSTTYLPVSTAEPTTGTFKPETTTYEPETTTSKPETTTSEPYSTRIPMSTTTNPHPHGCKPDCPAGLIVYYPDLRCCSKYWGCFNGIAVPQYCKPGLYFNPNTWVCERPEFSQCTADPNVHCHNVTTHAPVSTTHAPILTTTATPETTTVTPKCVPPCPFFEAMYPNPRNCNQFFKCAHDIPYLMDCPAGLEFSIFTNRCEYPKDAMCIDGPEVPCKARVMLH